MENSAFRVTSSSYQLVVTHLYYLRQKISQCSAIRRNFDTMFIIFGTNDYPDIPFYYKDYKIIMFI